MFPNYVPDTLAKLPQWIFWQSEITKDGKLTKVPYRGDNWTRPAASTRPEEWETIQTLYSNYGVSNRTGAGFVFATGGNIFGIDVDSIDKVAPEHQEASLRLRAMIHEHFDTYCEVSPSGTGRHYIGHGSLPEDVRSIKDSKYGIEVYDKERFFTFTGDVVNGRTTLKDCQDALNDLAHTMRGAKVAERTSFKNTTDERPVDEIIADIRGWSNGSEFSYIMDNPLTSILARYKQDHSAADLAACNFIATATTDEAKAVEVFRATPLWRDGGKGGYKPEEKYIKDYVLGWCMDKVWSENAVKDKQRKEMAQEGKAAAQAIVENLEDREYGNGPGFALKYDIDLPFLDTTRIDCPMPPGVAGEFVKAIHDACYTPVPEFAVAVGMAFLSGLTGRTYRFAGSGLNAFFMVGAKSGTGKTQSITALQTLLSSIEGDNGMIGDRLYAVSGKTVQGLHTYFERAPAGAWITDECGAQVKALTEPGGQSDYELKDAINSLFDAARPGKKWAPPASRISQKEDKSITCLSVGIGWFTTREKIYSALNDDDIADGFLSRFVPVFYNGTMGDDNYNQTTRFPPNVEKTLKTMWALIQENDIHMPIDGVANQSKMVTVGIDKHAEVALRSFGSAARNVTRRAQDDKDDMPDAFVAMSRVGLTAQRLAAVCAVMDNPVAPVIMLGHIQWAIQLVGSRMLHVLELMETGQVGSGENIAFNVIVRVMKDMLLRFPDGVPKARMHERLRHLQPFKSAKYQSPQKASKQAIADMIDDRLLISVVAPTDGTPGRPPEYYLPSKDRIWRK